MKLATMKIGTKILLGYGIPLLALVALAIGTFMAANKIKHDVDLAKEKNSESDMPLILKR